MDNKSYKIYLIAFFVILALPLLAVPPMFHPAAWGKALVFRIIVSSLLFFLIWKIISKKIKINFKDLLDRKNKVFWPFWLLITLWGIFLLATIFSKDPYYSFWESPYRAGGFLNFSLYIIFAILAFLIIRKKDWQKIWGFTLVIGALASIMAIFQYFEVFKEYLISSTGRPAASFGNSIFLAMYLLFLVFLALSFGLNPVRDSENKEKAQDKQISNGVKEKKYLKKFFYFSVIALFIFVILIIKARAVYLGLIIGFLYFFLLYPVRGYQKKEEPQNKQISNGVKNRSKKILLLKIITVIALFLIVGSIYFVNTQDQLPEFVENNRTLKTIAPRLSFELIFEEARFSAWKVSIEAIKERPILGWGPENFSVAFDKHYDPRLPGLSRIWWDRAHNFILDIAIEAGIPALIIYLSLFAALFWQLQKLKTKNPNDALICHGIQAVFIGYLTANFFSFDSFSTYLIFFLLVGYSLFLIQKNNELTETRSLLINRDPVSDSPLWKSGLIFGLFCVLVLFIWLGALKPLEINKELNWAIYYSERKQCEKAVEKIDSILSSHSIVDTYVRLQYLDIIKDCLEQNMERKYVLAPKAVEILRELKDLRPNYTRTWISLGSYLNILIGNKDILKIESVEELEKEADACYQRAHELSPKREEVFLGWIESDFISGKYQTAKEKAEQCINLNPKLAHCWWKKALAHIYLNELEQADENMAISIKMGHNINSDKNLFKLQRAYMKLFESIENEDKNEELFIEIYKRLADVYDRLIAWADPESFQYHASLSYIYKEIGEYDKARDRALNIVRLFPDLLGDAEEFFKSILDLDNDHFQYHFYLAQAYNITQNFKQAEQQGLIAWQYSTPDTKSREKANNFLRTLYFNLAHLHYEIKEYDQAKQKALIAWQYSIPKTHGREKIDEFLESLP